MSLLKFFLIAATSFLVSGFFPLAAQVENGGKWFVNIRHFEYGEMRTTLEFRVETDSSFSAASHRRGVKNLVGGFKATMGRWFTRKPMLRTGALCRIENGRTEGETFSGVLSMPMGSRIKIAGRFSGSHLSGSLTNASGKQVGVVDGTRTSGSAPADDYPAVVDALMEQYRQNIYDRRVLETKSWKRFAKKMKKSGKKAQDDFDLISAFFIHAQKLPFTHAYFYRTENPKAGKAQMSKRFASLSGQAWLEEKSPETVVLRVKSFRCTAEEMDSLMRIVMRKDYRNLIVDLRGNGGGSLEGGMTLARYLTAGETATGVYLTQKWFNRHPAPPTAVELASMPAFTKADVAAFTSTLDSAGYVVLKATPGPQQFTGKAFILTDRRTASACEPLTWNLKHYGRATVVGESTAGAMLSAESYPVKNGFTAVIPNGDYYTPEGNRLDRIGVAPHLAVNGEAALDRVMRLIEGK